MGVSRETEECFEVYLERLLFWQKSINLVSRETLSGLRERHLLDSQQVGEWLLDLLPDKSRKIADLGSGAGFPGMVLAMMGVGDLTLVESNGKKCSFLRDVKRSTGVSVAISQSRIEDLQAESFDVVVSRGLASLDLLLGFSHFLLVPRGISLFLKGKDHDAEIEEARKRWSFSHEKRKSKTCEEGVLLLISDLEKKT